MKVPIRIGKIIINALAGGVVPRTGLGYIAVGRENEIESLLRDVDVIEDGGSTFKFISGDYGSGKTFLLQTIKEYVHDKGFVVVDADLSPNRSLVGNMSNKKGLATYRELMSNMSIKTSPEGGALVKILDKWLNQMWIDVASEIGAGGIQGDMLEKMVSNKIYETILSMQEMVHGFDFANILITYAKASRANDIELKSKALRWLRGEYSTKTEAKQDFGINTIINDDNWYEYIKIFCEFLVKIGYKGMLVIIDELINIYVSKNRITRRNNYEKILEMYNDTMQGRAKYLGIIMGGTPSSITDLHRGVFSYEALRSRLDSGRYGSETLINFMTPIIKIQQLTLEEMIVLLEKLTEIYTDLNKTEFNININDIKMFVERALKESKQGITPRSLIRDYIEVLNILYQNNTSIQEIMSKHVYSSDTEIIEETDD